MTTDIGRSLQQLRVARKLTQLELAEKLGITRATVSNYETGRRTPHLNELKRLADFYGVGLDYFGVASTDEVFDLLSRAKAVFEDENVSTAKKDELYFALMQFYMKAKENN